MADDWRCMTGGHVQKGPCPDAELSLSRTLGKEWAAIRIYRQWQEPGRAVEAALRAGKLPVVSHKPPRDGKWRAVAEGWARDPSVAELAEMYRRLEKEVVVIFHHEPHDDASDIKGGRAGTARDFIGAFRRFADQMHERAPNVVVGYCAVGGWALGGYGRAKRDHDPLYPGNSYVDIECHDAYNWYRYQSRGRWERFEEDWRSLVDLARSRGHLLLPGEVGCHPDRRRDDWLREMATYLKSDHARGVVVGFCYFHSNHLDQDGWHDWRLFERDGFGGYRDGFVRDPFFTADPVPLKKKPEPPPKVPTLEEVARELAEVLRAQPGESATAEEGDRWRAWRQEVLARWELVAG